MHVDIWVTLGNRTPDTLDDVVEKVIDKDGCVGESRRNISMKICMPSEGDVEAFLSLRKQVKERHRTAWPTPLASIQRVG